MTDTATECQWYAESVGLWVAGLVELIEGGEFSPEDEVTYDDPIDYINETALEVYYTARHDLSLGTADVRSFTVVLGTGGPHYELVVQWNGHIEGRCFWSSDSATAYLGRNQDVALWLADLFEVEL